MANSNRTDYEGPPLSGPGVLWINSRITDTASLSVDAFATWYENIHIPDIIAAKPGGILASWRYQCTDKDRPAPFLAVYKVPDLAFLQSPEFKAIPMTHLTLHENGPIHRFAQFDSRFMGHVETWKRNDAKDSRTDFLISEAVEPADAAANTFHEWFRNGYIKEISQMQGWQRTTLLKLVFKKENKHDPDAGTKVTPTWLALHEFQPGDLSNYQNWSELLGHFESRSYVGDQAKKTDVAGFKLLSSFGEVDKRWADVEENII